jgi:PAS domain-containing protein
VINRQIVSKLIDGFGSEQADNFMNSLMPGQISFVLFQAMPDVMFWVKNAEGEFIFFNDAFRFDKKDEEILGKTDADFMPAELARIYMEDDQSVMQSGKPQLNKVELVVTSQGGVEWDDQGAIAEHQW